MRTTFLDLSRHLTGEPQLDPRLADEYLARLRSAPEGEALDALLQAYAAAVASGTAPDQALAELSQTEPDLRAMLKVIVLLWYFGEIRGETVAAGRPEHFFRGLFWSVIHAHPPALSGGYFGYWSYPPDN